MIDNSPPTINRRYNHTIIQGDPIPLSSYDRKHETAAIDGSMRLLVKLCQYHANRSTGMKREQWLQRGSQASMGRVR